jgi:hypothetical protein
MADTEDLIWFENLSAPDGNAGVDGVKVGEPLTDHADGDAELRLVEALYESVKIHKLGIG